MPIEERRLMAVHAHPDDESSKGAGMMAKYATAGRVRVVTLTGGERGDILNPQLLERADIKANIGDVRRSEMRAAAQALGVEHVWLGFVDSGLPEGDPLPPLPEGSFAAIDIDEPVRRLTKEIRDFRPQVVTTYDETGGYPHPDHIRTHEVTMAAVKAAADPTFHPELGQSWQVAKVYYDVTFTLERLTRFHEAMLENGIESPFGSWIERRSEQAEKHIDARIRVDEFFPQRDAALLAHATQIDPEGFFFAMPRDLEAQIWPWEEFTLGFSVVGDPDDVEADLFARVPGVEPLV
ncbi:mycothiol S-conjugate amidase [Arcanobacterium pluranimalium]|uniref:mycothiol conjugate amidase Mca n=1 Tax=Arcanobacterium pluranimalium TaxID=108028 RepID=UPI00195F0484|nr:mycothiol conjugate amidase Mca [Arcanobacterium pluranimalium]MBM7824815.1 mycothiol S-conjugate amidase [Arcanobacterium pluranimalium]